MQNTTNYNLKKPEYTDTADIGDINDNMDTIDTTMATLLKQKQAAKNDPTASGTAVSFIDTLSQNANGEITATKKSVRDASTSQSGLMSSADKTKLNGIANNANNYSLPLAASGTRGGIQLGYTLSGKNYPVQVSSEKAYVNVPWTDHYAWSDITGKPSTYAPPAATSSALGGIKTGYTTSGKKYPVALDSNSKAYVEVPWTNTTYSDATTSAHGLMTAADKTKLNGITAGATKLETSLKMHTFSFTSISAGAVQEFSATDAPSTGYKYVALLSHSNTGTNANKLVVTECGVNPDTNYVYITVYNAGSSAATNGSLYVTFLTIKNT